MWRSLAPEYGDNEAKAIVRTLLLDFFGFSLTDIVCGKVEDLPIADKDRLTTAMESLQKGIPVQYITQKAPFAGRTFHVEPGVLIPRPETELLCECVEEKITGSISSQPINEQSSHNSSFPKILDVGTGSGCIACTLALNIRDAHVTAWDISDKAIKIAQKNAASLGADICIIKQDALNPPQDVATWDAIVSNPPYICIREKAEMERNVLDNEPYTALFVPDDRPLLFYSSIAEYASKALKEKGWLLFEINPIYKKEMEEMLKNKGFCNIETRKDQFNKFRIAIAQKPLLE